MMDALEHEIIERFRLLTPEGRARVLSTLMQEAGAGQISLREWLQQAEAVQIKLRPDAGGRTPSASELVREAREERDVASD